MPNANVPRAGHTVGETSTGELAALIDRLKTEPVSALSALCAAAKKQSARDWLNAALAEREPVYALLDANEPKARKNAARLLGALQSERDGAALQDRLMREDTLFVVPSILLALGAVGGRISRDALNAYQAPAPRDDSERKHIGEICAALKKARDAFAKDEPLPERGDFSSPRKMLAVAPRGFADLLTRELCALGFDARQTANGALVYDKRIKKLYTARCLQEALLPIAHGLSIDIHAIAAAANEALTRPYRIELRGYMADRTAFIRALAGVLGGGDSPSRYVDELRVVCADATCDVFIRPCNVPDTRFAYRVSALPASIQPASAACLVRYAISFVQKPSIRAFDPFCGSGTLLFELERAVPCAALFGTDIARAAIEAARENAAAAHSRAIVLQKDALRFEPREPFDLILSNLPFGNRVGTHASNESLYRAFVHRLPALLANDGVAALYTADHALLMRCLDREKGVKALASRRTEAGGLTPTVTIVGAAGLCNA